MEKLPKPDPKVLQAFKQYSTCNISDALEGLSLHGGVVGILPVFPYKERLVGTAVTMRMVAYGLYRPKGHAGGNALTAAGPGDVIVTDNAGRPDQNTWGEIMAYAARQKGVVGMVSDGVVRDVDVLEEIAFPTFARGVLPCTIRMRAVEESVNTVIQCGGAQVRPGDIVVGDRNGVCFVPVEKAEEVLKLTDELFRREQSIIAQLKRGIPFHEVDTSSGYDTWLDKKPATGGDKK